LESFYPITGSGGSLPDSYFASCYGDHACLESVTLTCCVFDDDYTGSYVG
jgi:hypothetical protein